MKIEAPCRPCASGPVALPVGSAPRPAHELITSVKTYERATIDAALTGDPAAAVRALALNPVVPCEIIADRLVTALFPALGRA